MRKLLNLFVGVVVLMGCGQNEIIPAEEFLAFYPQTQLSGEHPYAVPGDRTVFHRHFEAEDDENIADDEYAEDFFFEVEEPGESFEFDTEDLREMKDLFLYYCYCGYTDNSVLQEASIKGTKKSATAYELEVDVTYAYYQLSEDKQDTLGGFTKRVQYTGIHQRDVVRAN